MIFERTEKTHVKGELYDGSHDSFCRIKGFGLEGSYDPVTRIAYFKSHNGTQSIFSGQWATVNEFNIFTVYNQESFLKNFRLKTQEQPNETQV